MLACAEVVWKPNRGFEEARPTRGSQGMRVQSGPGSSVSSTGKRFCEDPPACMFQETPGICLTSAHFYFSGHWQEAVGFLKLLTDSPTLSTHTSLTSWCWDHRVGASPTRSLNGPLQAQLPPSEASQSPWEPLSTRPPSGSLGHTRCTSHPQAVVCPPPPLPSTGAAREHPRRTWQL